MNIREKNQSTGEKLLNLLKTISDNQYVQCPCKVLAVNGNYVDVLPIINDDLVNQPLYDVKIQRKESSTAYIFLGVHVGDRGILRFFDRSIENYSINGSEEYNQDDRMHDANDGCFELGFLPDNEAFVYPTNQEIEIGLKNVKFKVSIDNEGNINLLTEKDIILNVTGDVTSTIHGNADLTVEGNVTSTTNGNVISTVLGNSTSNVSGTANLIAPTINTTGILNQTGAVNITGLVTVTEDVIADGISLKNHIHIGNLGEPTSKPQ